MRSVERATNTVRFSKEYYLHPVFQNYVASKTGEVINVKTNKILKPQLHSTGYCVIRIYDKSLPKPKTYYVHRFAYESIRGEIPEGFEIDHVNNCRTDNSVRNLQLLTNKKNVGKSLNKKIISKNVKTGEKKIYISIKSASLDLEISSSNISLVCNKFPKTSKSKKDGDFYTFKFKRK